MEFFKTSSFCFLTKDLMKIVLKDDRYNWIPDVILNSGICTSKEYTKFLKSNVTAEYPLWVLDWFATNGICMDNTSKINYP